MMCCLLSLMFGQRIISGSFSVAEPGIDTKQLFVGANLKYSYQQWFDIALKGVYNNWKAETDEGELPHAWGSRKWN